VKSIYKQLKTKKTMSYYLCKITFDSGEVSKSGKAVITRTQILVEAETVTDAETRIGEHLGTGMADFEVTSISKSPIESILQLNG
jgi:hypothetical protein